VAVGRALPTILVPTLQRPGVSAQFDDFGHICKAGSSSNYIPTPERGNEKEEHFMTTYKSLLLILSYAAFIQAAETAAPGKVRDDAPMPSFERIDYSKPQDYLFLNDNMGSRERIMKAAAQIEGETPEKKLVSIHNWLESNVSYKADYFSEWRTFDQMLDDKTQGGCAHYSVLFGSLARACGIPTVWVKTLDAEWIRGFRTKGKEGSWNGHVFLEIYIHDRWMLLDDTQLILYKDYDTKTRILPGNRYAYDKGGDPYELILSARWELWKKQVRAYFSDFDLSKLPMENGKNLLPHKIPEGSGLKNPAVYVFSSSQNSASCTQLFKILYPKLTHHLTGRNHALADYDEQLTENANPGDTVILLLTVDEKDALPEAFRDLLPKTWADIEAEVEKQGTVKYENTAREMKIVIFVAKNPEELAKMVEKNPW
jgi:hypothetical protein